MFESAILDFALELALIFCSMRPRRFCCGGGMRAAQLLAATVLVSGCDAKVNAFDVSSGHICAGDRIELSWDVTGSATVKVTPPLAGAPDGAVAGHGQATIAPTQPTRIELHVTRFLGNPTSSIQEIRLDRPESLTASLGDTTATPACANGRISAVVHAKRFAPGIKATVVAARSEDDRSYDVDHAGVHATVGPGSSVTQFTGLPVAGDWALTTPLRQGETCATTTLRSLGIVVFTECATRGTNES